MDFYLQHHTAEPGSDLHQLYQWIESMHERMDRLASIYDPQEWEHDYQPDDLATLELGLIQMHEVDPDGDMTDIHRNDAAGYLGEVLMNIAGGHWDWGRVPGDNGGLPMVRFDEALGLYPVVPLALVYDAVETGTEQVFAAEVHRLSEAVAAQRKSQPGWEPERVATPWIDELESLGTALGEWVAARNLAHREWWIEQVGGGWKRWAFRPESLDHMQALIRGRLASVEEYRRLCARPFWIQAAWWCGAYAFERKDAQWGYRAPNPDAPPGTAYAADNDWVGGLPFVYQRHRINGHAARIESMIIEVLEGTDLRDIMDRFLDDSDHTP